MMKKTTLAMAILFVLSTTGFIACSDDDTATGAPNSAGNSGSSGASGNTTSGAGGTAGTAGSNTNGNGNSNAGTGGSGSQEGDCALPLPSLAACTNITLGVPGCIEYYDKSLPLAMLETSCKQQNGTFVASGTCPTVNRLYCGSKEQNSSVQLFYYTTDATMVAQAKASCEEDGNTFCQ
jgi:hypothetical protein